MSSLQPIRTGNRDIASSVLTCPHCDFPYMHLEYVMVHAQREDSPGVDVVVQVQTGEHRVHVEMTEEHEQQTQYAALRAAGVSDAAITAAGVTQSSTTYRRVPIRSGLVPRPVEASGRRDHTVLRFSCEGCSGHHDVHFEQHKGNTYAGWNVTS